MEDPDEGPIKLAYYLLIAALAGGHASIILRSQAPSDPPALSTVRAGTLLALALLAGLGIAAISREDAGEPRILVVLAILYLLGSALIPILRRSSPVAPGQVPALDHVVIAVGDWERSNSFYREVLGAEVVELPRGRAGYRIGDVLLTAYGPGSAPTLAPAKPVEPGGSDLCFRWPRSAEDAIRHLRERGVEVAAGPVTRVGSGGPGTSVYFTDPDGSLIELISYDSASPESSSKSSAQELMQ